MQTKHHVTILQNSLVIDEMYFGLDEIRFVDVVEQELPLLHRLCGVGGGFCLFIALIFIAFELAGIAGFFFLSAIAQLAVKYTCKHQYALRIGQQMGTSKAIISTDRQEMERIRHQILNVMAERANR